MWLRPFCVSTAGVVRNRSYFHFRFFYFWTTIGDIIDRRYYRSVILRTCDVRTISSYVDERYKRRMRRKIKRCLALSGVGFVVASVWARWVTDPVGSVANARTLANRKSKNVTSRLAKRFCTEVGDWWQRGWTLARIRRTLIGWRWTRRLARRREA